MVGSVMPTPEEELESLKRSCELATESLKTDLMSARATARDLSQTLLFNLQKVEVALGMQKQVLERLTAALSQRSASYERDEQDVPLPLLRDFIEQVGRVSGTSQKILVQLTTLSEHVDLIAKDSSSIDQLARESRFIAFNARIETQRAGEAGATFKVVADEIKRLAAASATLSAHIRQEVSESANCLRVMRKSAEDVASADRLLTSDTRAKLFDVVGSLNDANTMLAETVARSDALISDAAIALRLEQTLNQLLEQCFGRIEDLQSLTRRAFEAFAVRERANFPKE